MLHYRPLMPGEAMHWSAQPPAAPIVAVESAQWWMMPTDATLEEVADRALAQADAAGSFELVTEAYRDHLEQLILQGSAVGAFRGRHCLGLAAAQPLEGPGYWQLWECQVRTPYRRHGVGSHLLRRLEERLASQLGARHLLGSVAASNAEVQRFMLRNNYMIVGSDPSNAPPLFIMRKSLVG